MSSRNELGGVASPGAFGESGFGDQRDEDVARDLLAVLLEDQEPPPEELPDRTIRKVQSELTSRDLIDLTTFVFLMRFCAPLLDLIVALFGVDPENLTDRRNEHE